MSTEQYPEVNGDESGLVPQQPSRPPEWPKKIRTLTAAELDRLTIDEHGRFYWDGRMVTYEISEQPRPGQARSLDPDPAPLGAHDLGEARVSQSRSVETAKPDSGDDGILDLQAVVPHAPAPPPATVSEIRFPSAISVADKVRVAMSGWQSVGMVALVIGILFCATGIAAYGWVMAHDWGCRVGMIHSYCPAPGSKDTSRTDIPA